MLSFFRAIFNRQINNNPGTAGESAITRLHKLRQRKVEAESDSSLDYQSLVEHHIAHESPSICQQLLHGKLEPTGKASPRKEKSKALPTPVNGNSFSYRVDPLCDSWAHSMNKPAMEITPSYPSAVPNLKRKEAVLQELQKHRQHGTIARSVTQLSYEETQLASNWMCGESLFAREDDSCANDPATPPIAKGPAIDSRSQTFRVTITTAAPPVFSSVEVAASNQESAPVPESKSDSVACKKFSETSLKLIAQSPKTAPRILTWLAAHENAHIRSLVAKNPTTPEEALLLLAKDQEAGIRYSLAESPHTSPEVLYQLTQEKNALIAWVAQKTLDLVQQNMVEKAVRAQSERQRGSDSDEKKVAIKPKSAPPPVNENNGEEDIEFLTLIAKRSITPIERLTELASHANAKVRGAVAENANTEIEVLWELAHDQDVSVRLKLAENTNLPLEILEVLKEDEEVSVADQARHLLSRLVGFSYVPERSNSDPQHSLTWP